MIQNKVFFTSDRVTDAVCRDYLHKSPHAWSQWLAQGLFSRMDVCWRVLEPVSLSWRTDFDSFTLFFSFRVLQQKASKTTECLIKFTEIAHRWRSFKTNDTFSVLLQVRISHGHMPKMLEGIVRFTCKRWFLSSSWSSFLWKMSHRRCFYVVSLLYITKQKEMSITRQVECAAACVETLNLHPTSEKAGEECAVSDMNNNF